MKEDPMPERPWTVTTAYRLLCLSVLLLPGIAIWLHFPKEMWQVSGLFALLIFGCWYTLFLVVYMILRGHNWARILFLILLLLGAPFSLLYIIQNPGHLAFGGPLIGIVQLECSIVGVVLLFQWSSSDWFEAVKKLRSKDESPQAI